MILEVDGGRDLSLAERLAEAEEALAALRLEEPAQEESDEHEDWEDELDDLMDEIDELRAALRRSGKGE